MKFKIYVGILLSFIFILTLNAISFSLTIGITRPFENLSQNSEYDWLNLAIPQIIYDAFFPIYDVSFDTTDKDILIRGRFTQIKGGINLTIYVYWNNGKDVTSSIIIGNPYDPLSMRDSIVKFISSQLSLPEPDLFSYSRDALMNYYKGIYYKYIGEMTYGDSSYPSQSPWRLAINYLRKAVELSPEFKDAYRELALSFRKTKWYAEEVKAWSFYINLATDIEIRKVSPYISEAYFNLAYSFYKKGRQDVALSYLTEAVNYDPQNVKAHYWLARIYYDMGKLYESKKEWDKVISLSPDYKSAKYFKEKVEKALKYGKEAYEYFEKGYLAYKNGDIDLAIDYINRAMKLNYKFVDTYYWLGRIEIERGNYKRAINYLQKGLNVDPSNKKMLYLIKLAKSKLNK